MLLALDSETTGTDFNFGSLPFFVTTCTEEGEQGFWEWSVDPLTRKPEIPEEDIDEIAELLSPNETGELVLQHCKFDIRALATIRPEFGEYWRWEVTHDTLIAGHLLGSNLPHDLTSMVIQYLGCNIEPYELTLRQACVEARGMVQQARLRVRKAVDGSEASDLDKRLATWRIAEEGLAEMPSVKGSGGNKKGEKDRLWKNDTWLPRAMAKGLGYSEDHPWWTVLQEYSNTDSATTLLLWREMERLLHERGLWEIYKESMKLVPVVYDMETKGVTINGDSVTELEKEYAEESNRAARVCLNIAESLGFDLELPKSGNNDSLSQFFFGRFFEVAGKKDKTMRVASPDCLNLPVIAETDTGAPAMNKEVLEEYEVTLPANSKGLAFVRALRSKRKRDTSLTYLESYRRFWIPLKENDHAESREESHADQNRSQAVQGGKERRQADAREGNRSGSGHPSGNRGGPTAIGRPRHGGTGDGNGRSGGSAKRVAIPPGLGRELGRQARIPEAGIREGQGNSVLGNWYVLHPSLNITGTDTLRGSSNNPNAQNVSKQEAECWHCRGEEGGCARCDWTGKAKSIRYCFGPAPGREWWAMDYVNIELMIPAYTSGEKAMIELFEKTNDPPYFGSYHLLNASLIYPDLFWPLAEKEGAFKKRYSDTWYQWCKNFGFAKQYRCGEATGDRAAHKVGAWIAVKKGLPAMEALNSRLVEQANRLGYVETLPDKTVNPNKGYPILCSRSKWGDVSPTIPLSYMVQSSAMQATRKAMVRCKGQLDSWNREDGFDGRITLQVHDEIVFDFPQGGKRNLPRAKKLRNLMERSGDDVGIPLRVSMSYHPKNWGQSARR